MFKMNFDDCTSYDILPEGEYEVVITDAKIGVSQAGVEHINLVLKIRDDVAGQKYGKRLIYHNLWKKKDTNDYRFQDFNLIGKACKLVNGKEYKSLIELLEDFKNKNCKVTIKHNEYNGKIYENINKWEVSNLELPFGTFNSNVNGEIPF